MTFIAAFQQRLHTFRERWRSDPAHPPRVWMREQWKPLAVMGAVVVTILLFDAWLATCGFAGCPSSEEIRSFRPIEGSEAIDRSGKSLGRLTSVRRINVPLADVPRHVQQAFIATEDRRFYEHNGLDWRGLVRAVTRNVSAMEMREGFSTITMQVARNSFTPRIISERSLRRKLLELRFARLIEHTLTKPQILELYLNVIYLGNGTYGVEAASRDLFGKSVKKVSLAEAAVLAALPKGPSAYTPRKAPERAKRRRDLVLSLMVREGYIDQAQARRAAAQPVRVAKQEWRPTGTNSYALDAIRRAVDSLLGPEALESGDVVVYTTIDGEAQKAAERAVAKRAAYIQGRERAYFGRSNGVVQGAMIAIDPRTGDVRAIVGGRQYERGGFNRALSARRQPGSAFKPFVYAAALSAGLSPATMVDDDPVEIVGDDGRVWTPANHGDEYNGRITLRRALMRSANAATVRVSRAVGEQRVVSVARRNGISSQLEPVPSIALGALEVTPLELVLAYAPFGNGGYRVKPRLIERIEGPDGRVLWKTDPVMDLVMDPQDAYMMTSMLRSAVDHGTGHAVREWGARGPIAGKTGTTNDGADVWFVGYTPTLAAAFWFGHDQRVALSGDMSGGSAAAPAWAEFFINGWRERGDGDEWEPPPGMVAVTIDAFTGELAGEWCPATQTEWFKPGMEPTEYCREHPEPEETWADDFGEKIASTFRKIFRF
ncbi:MAG TPA: PBP1A family penicillin-binding protein [Gemmatimonadaceae bacterium]|nr:PBP1A family penicillin-binding protein [Gemmatimonadaceae bacterium]